MQQASFRSGLQILRGARRIDALLSEDDAAAAVAALSPSDIFELTHEVGFEDAGDLIALATPAQIQGCLDFEGWDKDEFLPELIHPWLAAVIEAGFEKVGEVWAGLDVEARMLFLQRSVVVFDVTMGEGPEEDDEAPMMTTPDSFFVLKLLGDDDTQRLTMRLVEDLYRADAMLARHTIQGARSEPAAELEEMSYRWRAGRLADLGYIDFYEAIELFAPLDSDQIQLGDPGRSDQRHQLIEEGVVTVPIAVVREVLARPFLARALAKLEGAAAIAEVEAAIMYLVNRVLAAARAKPGQQEVVQRAANYASATLSLGLEAVARNDPDRGAEILRSVALPRLFRVGYTLTLRLARLANALAARATTAESPAREVCTALASPRPLWAKAADAPAGTGVRPFESLADIRRGSELLSGLTLRIALVEQLGVNLAAMAQLPEPRPSLETHLRTALARVMDGGVWHSAALTAQELARLRRDQFVGQRLTALARQRGHDAVATSLRSEHLIAGSAVLPAIINGLIDQVEQILGDILDPKIDPRFVEGLLVQC